MKDDLLANTSTNIVISYGNPREFVKGQADY